MPQNTFSPSYLAREARRFLYHFYRSYKDYLGFFGGMLLGILIVALLGRVFYELLDDLRAEQLGAFDDSITLRVLSWKTPALDWYLSTITHLGDHYAYFILTPLLGLYFYIRKGNLIFTLEVVAVLIVAGAISFWLKDLIGRPRPEAVHHLSISTLSFPSGHAMGSIAFYGFLIHLSWRIYKSRLKKIIFTIILTIIILSIGLSRIYLQVHYPSDVLSGFAAGGICLIFFILLFSALRFRLRIKGEDRQPDTATADEEV